MKVFSQFILLTIFFQPMVLAQQADDDIMLKAMRDELNRNMTELKLPDYNSPFFMMYGVSDQKTYSMTGILGSLVQSDESVQRFKTSTRVLVGDYSFNDESLEDDIFTSPTALEISLPLDNDYLGIRRSFWSTTDKVYRNAARHFAKHKETLKETGKDLADIPHRSFFKSSPVTLISSLTAYTFDKTAWEQKIRTLSGLFLKHPTISNSAIMLQYSEGYKYLVSSEGTISKLPVTLATLAVVAQSKSSEGEFAMKHVIHLAKSPDLLPTEQQLTADIEKVINEIESQSSNPKLVEEYSGPVLLLGPAVAELFSTALLSGRENIFANDNINSLTGFQYDTENTSLNGKIGKNVCNEAITIKATPRLKSYNGIDLLGGFDLDNEGIVPPEEVIIIERGVLKNLLNNRTITHPSQIANGFSSGPGIIKVEVAQKDSEKSLKEKLIAQAKKDGLDYAIIIREAPVAGFGLINVYKISVDDGKEQLLRNAVVDQTSLKTLKRIMGSSEKYQAFNLGGNIPRGGSGAGVGIISFIVPEAILLEELEIQPFPMPLLKEEQYVSSPLK